MMKIQGLTCSYCNGDLHHVADDFNGAPRDCYSGEDFYTCGSCGKSVTIESSHFAFADVVDPALLDIAGEQFARIRRDDDNDADPTEF
jgi:hypothetical protein